MHTELSFQYVLVLKSPLYTKKIFYSLNIKSKSGQAYVYRGMGGDKICANMELKN